MTFEMMHDLCRLCDMWIGYAGAGVAEPPTDRRDDPDWLASHCWICGRSRDEIRESRIHGGK